MSEKLVVKNLYKIFGHHPKTAIKMLEAGQDKEAILKRTGQSVGVHNASFTVNEGEVFVVMGLSGSGKSTLIRLINRLIEPSAGEIYVDGNDLMHVSHRDLLNWRRRDMSMVFQSFALLPHRTVLQNAAFGLEVAGIERREREKQALEALEQVGLKPYASAHIQELSGGMQQRVGLARALAGNPSLMLMDEAFSALDPLIRAEMQDELLRLQVEHARTIIFISHDLDEAMRVGDRIAIMNEGQIVQVGTPEEILTSPANDFVRSFFSGVNLSKILTAGDIAVLTQVTVLNRSDYGVRTALNRLKSYDREYGYVIDTKKIFHGVASIDSLYQALKHEPPTFSHAILSDIKAVREDTPIHEIFGVVAEAPCAVPVVDAKGVYKGSISKARMLTSLEGIEK